jgi:hypothetical protein
MVLQEGEDTGEGELCAEVQMRKTGKEVSEVEEGAWTMAEGVAAVSPGVGQTQGQTSQSRFHRPPQGRSPEEGKRKILS